MRGGRLHIAGNAGPWAGARMSGGTLSIAGNAGDHLGGALPGDVRGMNGGLVVVRGNAGARTGYRMRRGVIAIQGDAGDHVGARMIAGTVLVLGEKCGAYPGFAMRRGTLLLRRRPPHMLPTFADAGEHDLGFIELLARTLRAEVTIELDGLGTRVRRYVGDAATGGKGEVLVWST
jgi:formylmethanofuran dehydrogenase subunit C